MFFCILVHDYVVRLIGSLCCSARYYYYISVSPYYVVIQFTVTQLYTVIKQYCKRMPAI